MCVDVAPAHLDHPFFYRVPEALLEQVVPGSKVKVPFAATTVDAWVLGVGDGDVQGLRDVARVVTDLPALSDAVADLARRVADHYAGTLADVLRTAVPPRHARGERAALASTTAGNPGRPRPPEPAEAGWSTVTGGEDLLARVEAGESPRAAVRLPLAVDPWAAMAAAAVRAVRGGQRALLVVPDVSDVQRLLSACRTVLPEPGRVVALHHGLGAERRWRTYCEVRAGLPDVVIGTRAAAFAPLPGLGLVVVWDDGDDGHVEPHSPGWQSVFVARLHAESTGAALVLMAHSRSVQTQWLVASAALEDLTPSRQQRRRGAPRVHVPDPDDPLEAAARLPATAHRALADGLREGPVLVSVPRRGYGSALACRRCRTRAGCVRCPGRLVQTGPLLGDGGPGPGPGRGGPRAGADPGGALRCGWCGTDAAPWRCPECSGTVLRAGVVGVRRSAEEFARSFGPLLGGQDVVTSHGGQRVHDVGPEPTLVLATPGAEPVAVGGYAGAVLLDADAALARPGLLVVEETLRRWLHVGSLVRPATQGGRLVLVGDPSTAAVQALVRDAPEELAARLLAERTAAGLPPAGTIAAVSGDAEAVVQVAAALRGEDVLLGHAAVSAGASTDRHSTDRHASREPLVLGPVPAEDGGARLLLAGDHDPVVRAVRELLEQRSSRRSPGRVRVRIDPVDLD